MILLTKQAAFALLFLALCAAQPATAVAQTIHSITTADNDMVRPQQVPADFVITPFGYMHRSCVNEVSDNETQRADGRFQDAAGIIRQTAPCVYPRYDRAGMAHYDGLLDRFLPSGSPPLSNGWVASGSDMTMGNLQWISANWEVPSFPYLQNAQTLYYFPGVEDTRNVVTIQQPVMAWNGFNDRQWTLASWNCCVDGNANHSSPVTVHPGDSITGYAWGQNCDSTGLCPNWQVSATDNTLGVSSVYTTSAFGQMFNWSFGGVLEAYGVTSCMQFPASRKLTFGSIWLRDVAGNWISQVPWQRWISPDFVNCDYSVTTGNQAVTISMQYTAPAGVLTPAPPTKCGRLSAGQGLTPGASFFSCDSRFRLTMQLDGDLVLYQGSTALWSTQTHSTNTFSAIMQPDGNFVAYDLANAARWNTVTDGNPGAWLAIQNDGNLVVYTSAGRALWATNTCCH